jgi:hypothetical protein
MYDEAVAILESMGEYIEDEFEEYSKPIKKKKHTTRGFNKKPRTPSEEAF